MLKFSFEFLIFTFFLTLYFYHMTILKYLHFQNVENEILKDNNKNLTKIKSSSKT